MTRKFSARQGEFLQEYFVYCKKIERSMAAKGPPAGVLSYVKQALMNAWAGEELHFEMDDKQNHAGARKKALKELLEGIGMTVLGAVMWMLGGDFTFVEGVTTRNEGRSQMYLMAAAAALIIIGVVVLVMGLVHLVRPGKGSKDDGGKR